LNRSNKFFFVTRDILKSLTLGLFQNLPLVLLAQVLSYQSFSNSFRALQVCRFWSNCKNYLVPGSLKVDIMYTQPLEHEIETWLLDQKIYIKQKNVNEIREYVIESELNKEEMKISNSYKSVVWGLGPTNESCPVTINETNYFILNEDKKICRIRKDGQVQGYSQLDSTTFHPSSTHLTMITAEYESEENSLLYIASSKGLFIYHIWNEVYIDKYFFTQQFTLPENWLIDYAYRQYIVVMNSNYFFYLFSFSSSSKLKLIKQCILKDLNEKLFDPSNPCISLSACAHYFVIGTQKKKNYSFII